MTTTDPWDKTWRHGVRSRRDPAEPLIEVRHIDEATVVLRQSKQVNYEAPFMFLLFGTDRALLLDTGATADPARFPLRATVDELVEAFRAAHPGGTYPLVVAHTHAHGDHVAADAQFADRPDTTVVGRDAESVAAFFGLGDRVGDAADFDLGSRVLRVISSPGHHPSSITVYDPRTATLFTGDTVLPGRLYAFDFPAFRSTLDRLVEFTETHPVRRVVGCHIEMTDRPRRDYPLGATYQPRERRLPMTVDQLRAARDAAAAVADRPGVHVFDDFLIYNAPGRRDMLRMMARGLAAKARHAIAPARP